MNPFSLVLAAGLTALVGCADEQATLDEQAETVSDNMEIESKDFVRIATPRGMPRAWVQPPSKGWLGERGMCGPTALANTLRLFGIEKSPETVYQEGGHSIVGTTPHKMEAFMSEHHEALRCDSARIDDGKALLLSALRNKHVVNILLSGLDGFGMHWVTVVGGQILPNQREHSARVVGRSHQQRALEVRRHDAFSAVRDRQIEA
jgi:hypothetical protein